VVTRRSTESLILAYARVFASESAGCEMIDATTAALRLRARQALHLCEQLASVGRERPFPRKHTDPKGSQCCRLVGQRLTGASMLTLPGMPPLKRFDLATALGLPSAKGCTLCRRALKPTVGRVAQKPGGADLEFLSTRGHQATSSPSSTLP
jgi:hypothetical protein